MPAATLRWIRDSRAARLLGSTVAAVEADRFAAARALAERYHAVAVLKGAGRIDTLVRRRAAKLTPDRARYIAHPDWVASSGASPPRALWSPALDTEEALADTVRWYRSQGWL